MDRSSRSGRLLVRWLVIRWLVGLFGLGCFLLVAVHDTEAAPWKSALSPGPLHAEHAEFEGQCDSCHVDFKGTPDNLCLSCHEAIDDLIRESVGFHGDLNGGQCVDCHLDHRGRDASQTRPAASAAFDHGVTRFPLRGAHGNLECSSCHNQSLETLQTQPLGECTGCHEDSHASEFSGGFGGDCALCHTEKAFSPVTTLKIDHLLPMHGGHTDTTCQDCHAGGAHFSEETTCESCHEQTHEGTELACVSCHNVHGFEDTAFDHVNFTLPQDHAALPCLSCHEDFQFADTPQDCQGCHNDDRTHEPLGECNMCHTTTAWDTTSAFDHNLDTAFALTGLHTKEGCVDCHNEGETFAEAPDTCDGCHRAEAMPVHGDLSHTGDCSSCHSTEGFTDPDFDHSEFGFPLRGKHQAVECLDCHEDFAAEVADAGSTQSDARSVHTGAMSLPASDPIESFLSYLQYTSLRGLAHRSPRWVNASVAALTPQTRSLGPKLSQSGFAPPADPRECQDCHENPHGSGSSLACGDCHKEDGFEPSTFGIDHHAHTAFPLSGPHLDVACGDCHATSVFLDTPSECSACHAAPHNNTLGSDCKSCHSDAVGALFADAQGMSFDHDATGFPLTRRHSGLACSQCHAAGNETPPGECASCHLDPHAGGMSPECELCHRPDRWRLARFDHDLAGWPLRGRHHSTPCASCHVNQRWVGVPTDCFDCHALDASRANALRGDHPFGLFDCLDCHVSQVNWRLVR